MRRRATISEWDGTRSEVRRGDGRRDLTTPVAAVRAPVVRMSARLRLLSVAGNPSAPALSLLQDIAALPYVENVLALPDLHVKARMETPSSIAVTTRGALVPEFTSVAVNDGMGVVVTDLDARSMTHRWVERLLTRVGRYAAGNVLDLNRYSLDAESFTHAAERGASAVLGRYGLDPSTLERVESLGRVAVPDTPGPWRDAVPSWLLSSRLGRAEMGLNFGGNHFLELQEVAEVFDEDTARSNGLAPGRVVVMYHLGPGPFGGTLLHHYSRRRKVSPARVPFLFLSRLQLHARRRWRRSWPGIWHDHFQRNGWTPLPEDSEGGLAFRQALALATNVGYAYRMATVAAVRDALHEALTPRTRADLLCDISHNLLRQEPWNGAPAWVARHNSCPVVPGRLTIVAGDHDVPSMLAIGGRAAPVLHSHDHGAGHLIADWRKEGRLTPNGARTLRLRMTRGHAARVEECAEVPVRSSEPIDRLMDCLEANDVVHPVVRLRPLGTLKN